MQSASSTHGRPDHNCARYLLSPDEEPYIVSFPAQNIVLSVVAEAGSGAVDRIGTSHADVAQPHLVPERQTRPVRFPEDLRAVGGLVIEFRRSRTCSHQWVIACEVRSDSRA
jgi:hypothetical protein